MASWTLYLAGILISMRLLIPAAILFLLPLQTRAALPPDVQTMKDLDVMVAFIREHRAISSSLQSIDMTLFKVYYGEGCEASFGRKPRLLLPGWVGPAAPLVFQRSTCGIDGP